MTDTPQNKVSISVAVETDGLTIAGLRQFLADIDRVDVDDDNTVWIFTNDNSGPDRIEVFR